MENNENKSENDGEIIPGENKNENEEKEKEKDRDENEDGIKEVPSDKDKDENENNEVEEENEDKKDSTGDIKAFRWEYTEAEKKTEVREKKKRLHGILVYAIIITAAFLIALGILAGFAVSGKIGSKQTVYRTVYIRQDGSDTGRLSSVEVYEKNYRAIVTVYVVTSDGSRGNGSGVIISEDGYILTNYHNINNVYNLNVLLYDGSAYSAEIIGFSAEDDIALLKINASGLSPAEIGNSESVLVGETVYAIGTPVDLDYSGTFTKGMVSGIDRTSRVDSVTRSGLIQTDAAINPGNSGGALIDGDGKLIGIVFSKVKLSLGIENVGFAIPINRAYALAKAFMSDTKPVLGISCFDASAGNYYSFDGDGNIFRVRKINDKYVLAGDSSVTFDEDEVHYASSYGIMITGFTPGCDAENKLRVGDVITEINGQNIVSVSSVKMILLGLNVGDKAEIKYVRDNDEQSCEIILGETK